MGIDPELEKALCDVRKAYRLVAAYQRRILDMAKKIQDMLEYKPCTFDHPYISLRKQSIPSSRWSIDMLPLYNDLYMLYLPQKGDFNHAKIDEWMLELVFVNDTGFKIVNNEEPDPLNLESPENCCSRLWLRAFGIKEAMENAHWWAEVHQKIQWPDDGQSCETEKLWAAGKSYNLATIPDEQALERVIAEFKQFVDGKRKDIGVL